MLLSNGAILQVARIIILTVGLVIIAGITVHEERIGLLITVPTHLLELRGSLVMADRLLLSTLQHGDHFPAVVGLVALILHFLHTGAMSTHRIRLLIYLNNLSLLLHGSI